MASEWSTTKPFYSSTPGVDPAIDWALGPGRRYYFVAGEPQEWLPVVLQLNEISVRDLTSGSLIFESQGDRDAWTKTVAETVRIPSFFIDPPKGLEKSKFCTAMVTEAFLKSLIEKRLVPKFIKRIELSLPLRAASLPRSAPPVKRG